MMGFPNLRVLELVQHVHVIARGELMGVTLKNVSFCQHGMDKVELGSGIRWFMVISSSYGLSDCCDLDQCCIMGSTQLLSVVIRG